jgi:predicted kinase
MRVSSSYLADEVMTPTSQSLSHLIVMKGHPATGKSTLAHALARTLGWPVIDKDDIKDHTLLLPDGNRLAYSIMWQITERQLALGISLIVDSPLSYPVEYATACDLVERYGARLLVVETQVDEERWRAHLEARAAGESTHKIRGWQKMQAQLQLYNDCWRYPIQPEHHLPLDTNQPLEELVKSIHMRIMPAQSIESQLLNAL